ncbi:MAG: GAF domain-containing protein, partial [Candidatus Omnitrophica bacterium]|nr:GAF domain-containing protein [Candidatus Omnitrophota bacterium]
MKELIKETNDRDIATIKDFLNASLKEMIALLEAESGSLFLFDSEQQELVLDSFYNSVNLPIKGLRRRIGEGVAGKIADNKKSVLVKDIKQDNRFKKNGFTHYHTDSFVAIPLFGTRGFIGIISVTDKKSGEPFSEKDLRTAELIARYACATVDKLLQCQTLEQEKQLLEKQKNFLEKYASVGKLAAGIVHEVNNPLDGVIRYTNMLLSHADTNNVAREYIAEIKQGLNRIAGITKSLLEFSHQVNSSSAPKNYIEVHKLIDDSLEMLSDKHSDRVMVTKRYAENVPRLLNLGLSPLIRNLIKNAFDAMPAVGTLEITTEIKEGQFIVTFYDSGIGIPDECKPRIFEPFFTTKTKGQNAGLWLAMCNEIIKKYDGHIKVESSLGRGSRFSVFI